MDTQGYSRTQILLHWFVVVLILGQYVFAESIEGAYDAWKDGAPSAFDPLVLAHIVGGILVLGFALWRMALKRARPQPAANLAVKAGHAGLYALMILMPITGAMAWFGGQEAGAAAHNLLKVVLLAFVAGHVFMALYHQFILKDGLMTKILRPRT